MEVQREAYECRPPLLYITSSAPQYPLTSLIVRSAHEQVQHSGVKETLTEIRAKCWIVKGRSLVRSVIYRCVPCCQFEGKPFHPPHQGAFSRLKHHSTLTLERHRFTSLWVTMASIVFAADLKVFPLSERNFVCKTSP